MDRRRFIRSALIGTGAAAVGGPSLALAEAEGAATTRRFAEQRWTLDNIIRANGIDWDQPRSIYLSAPCGVEANADFAAIRARVQKMADIGPAFESTAKRREAKARDAEAEGNRITARDNWYMAAIHYGAAEWPYDDSGQQHIELHKKKRDCYANYARLADHKIEAVSIPFKGKSIPAWFHLPPGYSGGKVPVVIVDSRHGQLQGDQRGARQRPLDAARRRRAGDRRARPVRKPAARRLCLDAELDRCRTGAGRLAAAATGDRWRRRSASPARASARSSARSWRPTSRASPPPR